MAFSSKLMVSTGALIMGLSGIAYASGDHQQSGHTQSQAGRQSPEFATIEGEIQKIDGNAYTIKDGQGGQVRLHLEESALQGKSLKEGDKIKAKIKKGDETYTVLSTKKAGQSSIQSQSQSEGIQSIQSTLSQEQTSQQDGTFTKTLRGEVKDIEGNVYYIQDPSGKEVRLRIDQSTDNQGDIQKGDTIEALVTLEKEYHVISAEPSGSE